MRWILFSAMLFAVSPLWADWKPYSSANNVVFFLDPATIKYNGKFRRVWTIADRKESTTYGNGERSARIYYEIDCTEGRLRVLSMTAHSLNMAKGDVLRSNSSVENWDFIAPATSDALLMNNVCLK